MTSVTVLRDCGELFTGNILGLLQPNRLSGADILGQSSGVDFCGLVSCVCLIVLIPFLLQVITNILCFWHLNETIQMHPDAIVNDLTFCFVQK